MPKSSIIIIILFVLQMFIINYFNGKHNTDRENEIYEQCLNGNTYYEKGITKKCKDN
jgi:hypothetical protein